MRLTDLVTPLKPLEAIAMGKPYIASDVGGHKELITYHKDGILFKAGDLNSLSTQLQSVYQQSDFTAMLERAKKMKEGHNWAAPYQPIYLSLPEKTNSCHY